MSALPRLELTAGMQQATTMAMGSVGATATSRAASRAFAKPASTIAWLLTAAVLTGARADLLPTTLPVEDTVKISYSYKSYTGTIPTEFGELTKLTEMQLNSNSLTGHIPTELGACTGLTLLTVDSNTLNGALPSELGLLQSSSSVTMKFLSNALSLTIPTEIGNFVAKKISVTSNSLSGAIPTELGKFIGLRAQLELAHQLDPFRAR
mmetsp:Transcript_107680/g.313280  ORF Transcript_107680/g.313280 Transcript_107680/m.313280 type:complete len:208 (+) Transcript_107680:367-990(+)